MIGAFVPVSDAANTESLGSGTTYFQEVRPVFPRRFDGFFCRLNPKKFWNYLGLVIDYSGIGAII